MYFGDHPPPHIHVEYQGFEALVRIEDGEIGRGRLPKTAHKLVRKWIGLHRQALVANFERAQDYQRPQQIAGLDDDAG